MKPHDETIELDATYQAELQKTIEGEQRLEQSKRTLDDLAEKIAKLKKTLLTKV